MTAEFRAGRSPLIFRVLDQVWRHEFPRFVLVRLLCAVASYGIYAALLLVSSYEVAYVASYVFGVALAFATSSKYVFQKAMNVKSALLFPSVYLVQFALGFVVIKVAVDRLGVPEWLGLGVSVAATLPATYILSKWVIGRNWVRRSAQR